jgi:hypothetical protein
MPGAGENCPAVKALDECGARRSWANTRQGAEFVGRLAAQQTAIIQRHTQTWLPAMFAPMRGFRGSIRAKMNL